MANRLAVPVESPTCSVTVIYGPSANLAQRRQAIATLKTRAKWNNAHIKGILPTARPLAKNTKNKSVGPKTKKLAPVVRTATKAKTSVATLSQNIGSR